MYIPQHFEQTELECLQALIRARPLATLVTRDAAGLNANHIPLILVTGDHEFGVLRGHVARANPVWRDPQPGEVLAIFHGADAYVSPSWYASKAETGRVVPTWNYAVAHAYGTLRVVDDATWIRAQIEALTAQREAEFAQPWSPGDAPVDYIDKLIGAVVGIEIPITRLEGKWKLSQNQSAANRAGVIEGLSAAGDRDGAEMAKLVRDGS